MKAKRSNITVNAVDYVRERGDLSFEAAPINELDMFLLSQIVMVDFSGIVSEGSDEISLEEAAERYFETHDKSVSNLGALQSSQSLPAFDAMMRSDRFKDIMLCHHVNYVCQENEEQFSATTFRLAPDLYAIAYRGTDDYLIGWKEDCHMAFYDEVPAQRDALMYLEKVAADMPGKILIAGHSKGGNLAVYAPSYSDRQVQDRIVQIFNYDGPGFSREFLTEFDGYTAIKDRITTFVSQHSIIGLLMDIAGNLVYTKSDVEGPYAHDGFNWEVERDHFVRSDGLSKFSRTFDEVFEGVLGKLTEEEKQRFVDEVFGILFDTGAYTVSDIKELNWRTILSTANRIRTSKAVRDFFNTVLVTLVRKEA